VWFLAADCISDEDRTIHVTCFGIEMMPGILPDNSRTPDVDTARGVEMIF